MLIQGDQTMTFNCALTPFVFLVLASASALAYGADVPAAAAPQAGNAKGICGSTELSGFYGFVASGMVPSKLPSGSFRLALIQEFGEVKYGVDGTAAAKIKIVLNGVAAEKTIAGKYKIDSSTCAGILQWNEAEGPTWHFVVVSNGAEIDTIDARGAGTTEKPAGALVFAQKRI
jgi:hypothetical protein